jgi:carbamoyl-phosphate synthase large subunit
MTEEFNVLVSSAGRRVALVEIFRRTLKDMGLPGRVFATDMSRSSAAFHAADAGFLVPRATDPTFIPALIDLCREERIRLIVPTIDPEQRTLARARDLFAEAGITVAVSSPDVVEIAADKWRTHEWLTGTGLPTVRQARVDEVLSNLSEWQFPLIVKPRFGTAGIGVSLARDADHLESLAHGIPASVTRLIEEGKLTEEDGPGEAVVQTVARGREHTVDILVDRAGRCVCAVTRVRLEVRSGESSISPSPRSMRFPAHLDP